MIDGRKILLTIILLLSFDTSYISDNKPVIGFSETDTFDSLVIKTSDTTENFSVIDTLEITTFKSSIDSNKTINKLDSTMIIEPPIISGRYIEVDSLKLFQDSLVTIVDSILVTKPKYKYGGCDITGFDCSGFVYYVFLELGYTIPNEGWGQSTLGDVIKLDSVQTGDIMVFGINRIQHVALVLSNADNTIEIVHSTNRGLVIDYIGNSVWNSYWGRRYLYTKRFVR